MNRRRFLQGCSAQAILLATGPALLRAAVDPVPGDWLARWERRILEESRNRYCDRETGEEIGWLVSPFLLGFYHGYRATGDVHWVERFLEWTDACVRRIQRAPDGFPGWPKREADGTAGGFLRDSQLGEAMFLRPVVAMSAEILNNAALTPKYGAKAAGYIDLAEEIFEKWNSRGCWRELAKGAGIWVVPEFGYLPGTDRWSDGYLRRATTGFSHPANKQNEIARWLLALADATGKPVYRARAQAWFLTMRTRLRWQPGGNFLVWNYWDPAGPWDYNPDGTTRHWVGVHPNGGYYAMDVDGMVAAREHGLVFTAVDIGRLVATNRDAMWNGQVRGAKFRRIDGGPADPRWAETPGVLWTALVPYNDVLQKIFVTSHDPASWVGLSVTPWYLARLRG